MGLGGEKVTRFINSNNRYIYGLSIFSLFTLKKSVIYMQNEIKRVFEISTILIGTL